MIQVYIAEIYFEVCDTDISSLLSSYTKNKQKKSYYC